MRALLVFCFLFVISYCCESNEPARCGLNEELKCVKECPPEKTCRNRKIQISCLNNCKPCTKKCVCKEGYYRNAIGECITGAQCDKCSRKNEFYSCGSACDNECRTLGTQNRTMCPIINIKCNEMCYCDDGYARDERGNCIPIDQCPTRRTCRDHNEIFTCKKSCPPETCISLVAKFKCDSNEKCQPRCACKPGYYRLKEGMPCMPMCQCPEMRNSPECRRSG